LFQRAQAHAGVIASYELQQKNKKKMARRALVLAGGGVRGVFTLCVLNHMRQSNTHKKIDIVVGTSAGAFIGALLCFQHVSNVQALWQRTKKSPQMAADIIASAFSDRTQFGPLLAPMYTGRAKRHTLINIFGKTKMSAATIPFIVVCATYTGHARVIKSYDPDDGNVTVVDAIDASTAVPIMFPPVKLPSTQEVLIDGGVIANVPIRIAFITARRIFGDTSVRFLVIGRVDPNALSNSMTPPTSFMTLGAGRWLALGLLSIVSRERDTTDGELLHTVLRPTESLEYLDSPLTSATDDTSKEYIISLCSAATRVWRDMRNDMLFFK